MLAGASAIGFRGHGVDRREYSGNNSVEDMGKAAYLADKPEDGKERGWWAHKEVASGEFAPLIDIGDRPFVCLTNGTLMMGLPVVVDPIQRNFAPPHSFSSGDFWHSQRVLTEKSRNAGICR